jgi:hypothetical protein
MWEAHYIEGLMIYDTGFKQHSKVHKTSLPILVVFIISFAYPDLYLVRSA